MTRSHLGELSALLTAVCWTASALSFESSGKRVGSLPVTLIRLPIAFLLLCGFSLYARGVPLPVDAPPRSWLWLSASGLVGFVVGDLFLFQAFVLVGSRLSMLVMTLVPLFAASFGRMILGERLHPSSWVGIAVTLAGIGLVVSERGDRRSGGDSPARGALFALGGALGQSMGLVLSKLGMQGYNAFSATQIRVIAATAGLGAIVAASGALPRVARALRDPGAVGAIAVGSFFGPFLGVSFSLLSVQNTEAGVASTIMAIVPVLIIPPSVVLFKERVTVRGVAGALAAVGGVALLFLLKA